MNRKNYIFIIISIIFLIIGGLFCIKAINKTKKIVYSEKSTVDYIVCLKENDYYEDTCLNQDREYLSTLTDMIRINFNYNKISENNDNIEYYIGSDLVISSRDNGKEVYNSEKKLSELKKISNKKEVVNIVDSIDIKYDEYRNVVTNYKTDYSLTTTSVLKVYLALVSNKKEKRVATVLIPIDETTYSIDKELIDSTGQAEIDESYKDNLIIGILSIIVSIVMIVLTVYKHMEKVKKGDFEVEVNKILTEYDRVIVETKLDRLDISGKELIETNDLFELIDVRDTIEKPIMYIRRNDYIRDFIVQDGEIIYRYRMVDSEHKDSINEEDPVIKKIQYSEDKKPRDDVTGKTLEMPKVTTAYYNNMIKEVNKKMEGENESCEK